MEDHVDCRAWGEEITRNKRHRCMKEKVRRSTRDMRTRKVQWCEEGIKKSWWKEQAIDKVVVTITKRGVKAAKEMKENGRGKERRQEIIVMSGSY